MLRVCLTRKIHTEIKCNGTIRMKEVLVNITLKLFRLQLNSYYRNFDFVLSIWIILEV